jgi:phenylacetate-CoA ligase
MSRIRRLFNTAYVGAYGPVERTIPFRPIERIEQLQRYRLRAIIRHAYDTVPFYRQAMNERGLRPSDFRTVADLSKLPLIDGVTLRTNTEAFLSTRCGDDSRQGFYSAGSSSGIIRLIYWDNTSILRKLACHERDRVVLNNLLGSGSRDPKVYIIPSESTGIKLRAYWREYTLLPLSRSQHQTLSPDQPLDVVAERINDIRPQVVFSYGSYAEHFFRFLADRQMRVAVPRVWVSGGDMLSPRGRELIENRFGCPTYSTYQSTETGRLGFECERRQGFHLNIDLCSVRLIDEDGRTVEPGEVGEVVISNLHNRATVLLNYRLDDWGVMAREPCTCGRSLPVLQRLEGRTSEMLHLADGRSISGLTLEAYCDPELTTTIQLQIVQPRSGQIRWRIVPFSNADRDTLRRSLLEKCRLVLGEDTQVDVEFVEKIRTTPQGKLLRVVCPSEPPDGPDASTQGDI